jgi:hypothetical protein
MIRLERFELGAGFSPIQSAVTGGLDGPCVNRMAAEFSAQLLAVDTMGSNSKRSHTKMKRVTADIASLDL